MPTYEYACEACGHEFERVQRITGPPARTCPKCKKRRLKRLVTGGSFILKGSGWYSDGYSGKGAGKPEGEAAKKGEVDAAKRPEGDSAKKPEGDSAKKPESDSVKKPESDSAKKPESAPKPDAKSEKKAGESK